jgi:hypothetical protein
MSASSELQLRPNIWPSVNQIDTYGWTWEDVFVDHDANLSGRRVMNVDSCP